MSDKEERQLDETLTSGRRSPDPEIDALAEQAEDLRRDLTARAPAARHERAMFVQGVAGRSHPWLPVRFLAPAAIVVAALVALAGFGRTALPGQTLWPVREALATVGLAPTPEEEIDRRIDNARAQCREAADLEHSQPDTAIRLVMGAIGDLDRARALTRDLSADQRSTYRLAITEIEDWAIEMISEISRAEEEEQDRDDADGSGPGEDGSGGDDNSGPGGDDDSGSGDDDNSGSGSDDSGDDDNSGSGSDDSGDDDNSGSGSDDSGDDDNSGSGSDDSGGGGDSSGSGSGGDSGGSDGSGSGSGDSGGDSGGDSSGSGSGDDD